ncbi:uncharacterized protein LOC127255570 isoform X2 [Andrographis paniculata]|uniref:uncharacterized protein LOC127255570 isoform X2 n=1 Tax=Andrographis paniculata TaxID=175694 RepID=UPI0021E743AF|nr:uncharacterized protein LOC127255570 isoform X2 [Andrographis paniculata]
MEIRRKKYGGVESPGRNRSLDVNSFNESRITRKGKGKSKVLDEDDQEGVTEKKRKRRQDVSSSTLEFDAKEKRKEDVKRAKPEVGFKKKSTGGSRELHGILVDLGDDQSAFNVPKRPRGSMGHKKLESDQALKQLKNSKSAKAFKARVTKFNDDVGDNDQMVQSATDSVDNKAVSDLKHAGKGIGSNAKLKRTTDTESITSFSSSDVKLKQKARNDDVKKTRKGLSAANEYSLIKHSGDTPSKKQQSSRWKKGLAVEGDSTSTKKLKPSVGSSNSNISYNEVREDDDEDEENLEQNAARMLSSRFDPSCTGFSSKRKSSASPIENGFSHQVSSGQNSRRSANSLGAEESASDDDKTRVLRPRREGKSRGVSRKRRHFYDILPRDFDPHWVLNRRIKLFWPLDDCWYSGLVNDYQTETKLHHVKYDDRDEEWVDLQEENFKLLLFPSEVPGKAKSRKRLAKDKDLRVGEDSESIASWLANQSRHANNLTKSLKKQKISKQNLPLASLLLSEKSDKSNHDMACSNKTRTKPNSNSQTDDNLIVHERANRSLARTTSSTRSNIQMVYLRKKYRKKCEGSGLVSRDVKACGWADEFSHSCVDSKTKPRSLNDVFLESKEFRFKISLLLPSFREYLRPPVVFKMFNEMFVLRHGMLVPTSSAISLEILFIDSKFGLRVFLFEGFLREALVFLFSVSSQLGENWNGDLGFPVTSMRFRLSSLLNRRKHVFTVHKFAVLQSSEWLYVNSQILQHCSLVKQIPASECTYDNDIMPRGISGETCNSRTYHCSFNLVASPREVPEVTLSVSDAPTFFFTLHLHLLVKGNFASVNHQHQDALPSSENLENRGQSAAECAHVEPSMVETEDVTAQHNIRKFDKEAPTCKGVSSYQEDLRKDSLANNSTGNINSVCLKESIKIAPQGNGQTEDFESEKKVYEQDLPLSPMSIQGDSTSSSSHVDIPTFGHVNLSSDVDQHARNVSVHDCYPGGSRSSSKHGRSSSRSSILGRHSQIQSNVKLNFMSTGFSNGPKKPRTRFQYMMPLSSYDSNAKQKTPNLVSPPCKRIRRASVKKMPDGSGNSQKNLELSTCIANLLVTHGDKGWRESGVNIVLEAADHKEWRLSVKLGVVSKYSYKVKHILQPGSTNRYSNAMMWKGGKDWVLEFPDRSQWMLFKDMHEECYNRNIRAASVKNIPIPGVRLVEESNEYGTDTPFIRPAKYFQQVQTDAEMALDPSRISYDIDSDDEQWLTEIKITNQHKYEEISEEFLERAMDMFEKVSYTQHCDNLTNAEVEKHVKGIGPVEAGKIVYEYWRLKREKKGMPLIRPLQPPLWQRYQQQLKEWERAVAQRSYAATISSQEKIPPPEKPAMFAFCLRPRRMDVTNKSSKQRSHKKSQVSGHRHASRRDRYGLFPFGSRRAIEHPLRDDKFLYATGILNSSFPSSPLAGTGRILSPREGRFFWSTNISDRKVSSNTYKRKSKNLGNIYNEQNSNMGSTDYSPRRPLQYHRRGPYPKILTQLDPSHLDDFRLRDASSAARHARNMAKLKRERAQRLLHRADLAVHKAVVALMTAEAMKNAKVE